jgi:hypothetical protein
MDNVGAVGPAARTSRPLLQANCIDARAAALLFSVERTSESNELRCSRTLELMKMRISAHTTSKATPPDPAQVAIAAFHWRRTGLLQRLVKLGRRAQAPVVTDRPPAETAAARRSA